MKKIINIVLFFILIFFILINSSEIIESIRFSFSICINNLFPSLIPFMLISNVLVQYNFINDLSEILGKTIKSIFKINENCSFALIMSILSGSPSNAIYLRDLYNNNLINTMDINKCLKFCHFTNPIFILGTIGYTFLGNKKLGLIVLMSHYFSSFILGIINKKSNTNHTNTMIFDKNNNNFIKILKDSINNTVDSLLLILGIITTSLIITTLINNLISINNDCKFIYGIIEITQGLKYLSLSSLNIKIKTIIASMIISFGGLSIHAQVFSILDNKDVRYFPYLTSRIIHSFLSGILSFILLEVMY